MCHDTGRISDGAKIKIDLKKGYAEVDNQKLAIESVPPFMQNIIDAGGLVNYAKELEGGSRMYKSRR